ncbi:MAG TPA: PIN domain-containing protein [Thermoanaerobaculia bacterium]|jgi:predicted nucleic acid-binding protein|nr:PIN domain-containing protein [Thermoanaerobaculia bacterium]
MREYFVDTWLLIASLDREDENHRQARRLGATLAGAPLVTHDGVLTELLAFFSGDGARMRRAAVDAIRRMRQEWIVLPAGRELFDRALTRYEQRLDKEYSLVDCMSMVVMEDRGIQHVLTNDHHFSQAGFTVVNE